jgi:hypothetical protein
MIRGTGVEAAAEAFRVAMAEWVPVSFSTNPLRHHLWRRVEDAEAALMAALGDGGRVGWRGRVYVARSGRIETLFLPTEEPESHTGGEPCSI